MARSPSESSDSPHFGQVGCRSLTAWIRPSTYADLATGFATNRGHFNSDIGMTTRSALIASCRSRHDVMFSTARSASSVSASRTTTGTSARPSDRAAAIRWKTGDQLEDLAVAANDDRDEHALQRDRPGKRFDVRLVERAHVLGHADLFERELSPGLVGDCGHVVLLWSGVARPAGGRPPRHPHARQGVPSSGGGSARQPALSSLARSAS
jgi:hypothetical protein